MSLKDLGRLYKEIKFQTDLINQHNLEREVPMNFLDEYAKEKEGFRKGKFISSFVKDKQIRFIPHHYFYLALECMPMMEELLNYKKVFDVVFKSEKDEVAKSLKGNVSGLKEFSKEISTHLDSSNDITFFNRFLTDYEWFYGSKTIDRGDFWNTTISNLAGLVHADSASFITICNEFYNKPLLKNYLLNLETIQINGTLRDIAFNVSKLLIDRFGFEDFTTKFSPDRSKQYNFPVILKSSLKQLSSTELTSSNTLRWFSDEIFKNSEFWYFTTQWAENELNNYFMCLNESFSDQAKISKKDKNTYVLELIRNGSQKGNLMGRNIIVYGAPGTGKSFSLNEKPNPFRTVFHSDYQNSDFVGSYKPYKAENGITYKFVPGPFIDAFVHAYLNPNQKVSLIIEEINRGNCAAIFGEIFQLLDRKENGESEYQIDPEASLRDYLTLEKGLPELIKLHLPSNLSLFATMNSADQGVSVVDSAFKRRWEFEYLQIDLDDVKHPHLSNPVIRYNGKELSFKIIAKSINEVLSRNGFDEDRLLGQFFLNKVELRDTEKAMNSISRKVFLYLWDDVLRHNERSLIFNVSEYENFSKIVLAFNNGKEIFSKSIEEAISKHSNVI